MAHLTIEYSPTLDERADIPALCRTLHAIMLADPLFPDATKIFEFSLSVNPGHLDLF